MIRRAWLAAFALAGCAHARTADQYRTDVGTALGAHDADIKSCYDGVLATTASATGRVTVQFAVEEKTGRVTDVKLDSSQTTAPDAVSQCVLAALPAVTIQPADRKRGMATWSWEFTAQAAPPAAPASAPASTVTPAATPAAATTPPAAPPAPATTAAPATAAPAN